MNVFETIADFSFVKISVFLFSRNKYKTNKSNVLKDIAFKNLGLSIELIANRFNLGAFAFDQSLLCVSWKL